MREIKHWWYRNWFKIVDMVVTVLISAVVSFIVSSGTLIILNLLFPR